jgi:hypothetical protein
MIQKLQEMGNPSSEEDVELICKVLDISFPSYPDFLILMTEDVSEFPPKTSGISPHYPIEMNYLNDNDQMKKNLIPLLSICMKNDLNLNGTIHQSKFLDICSRFGFHSGEGSLSYFFFAHQLLDQNIDPLVLKYTKLSPLTKNSSIKQSTSPTSTGVHRLSRQPSCEIDENHFFYLIPNSPFLFQYHQ